MTKLTKGMITLFLLLSAGLSGWTQNPSVMVQTILTPPAPEKFSQIKDRPDVLTLVVQNMGQSALSLKFRIEVDGHNGISVLLDQGINPTHPLQLNPQEVKTLTLSELGDMYSGISESDLKAKGINLSELANSQRIPDGNYQVCVTAYDVNTGKLLSGSSPMGCSNMVGAFSVEPPVITSPEEGEEIDQMQPQFISLNWTPVQAPGSIITYSIKLVRVPDGISPYRAMSSTKFTIYEQANYPATLFVIGPQVPQLETNMTYAVQITARDLSGSAFIANNGRSEIVSFRYTGQSIMDLFETDFFCGTPCTPPALVAGPDIASLNPGDLIQIGHFRVLISEVNKVGNAFSGTGSLLRSSFFHAPIRVSFNTIRINRNKKVYQGTIRAVQEQPMLQLPGFNPETGFGEVNPEDHAEIHEVLFNPLSSITESMADFALEEAATSLDLPVSHGTGDQRIVITGLVLTPSGADMDIFTFLESPMSLVGEREFFAFGASDICVSPGGYATGATPLRMNLLNQIDIAPNSQYSLHFTAGSGDRGCYADFDCDGLTQIHLGGYMAMNEEHIKPADANGEIIPGKRFAAGFQMSMQEWGEWMTRMDLENREVAPGVLLSDRFQITGLDDYVFRLSNVWLDLATDENPAGIVFPAGYGSPGSAWEGLYARNVEVTLPDYFENGAGQRITIGAEHLIIDGRGLSVDLIGRNLMVEEEPGKLDTWDFTINELRLGIVRNNFSRGSMAGIIKPEIFETAMPYAASMSLVNGHMDYQFRVTLGRNLSVPMWECTMNLDRSSTLSVEIRDGNPRLSAVLNGSLTLNETIGDVDGFHFDGLEFEDLRLSNSGTGISGGRFNLGAGIKKSIGSIDVTLNEIGIGYSGSAAAPRSFLRFDLGFGFGDNTSGFNATGGFKINASKGTDGWGFDGLEMDMIRIKGSTSVVSLDVLLEWYSNDPDFGVGFRGVGDALFLESYGVQSEVLFGTRGDLDYWFVDAAAFFSPPVPLVGIFGLNAFGGGAYYNMQPRNNDSFETIGSVSRKANYVPSRNGWGFKILGGIATSDGYFLSGLAGIEAAFGSGGSLHNIRMDGSFDMMKSPSYGEPSGSSMIHLEGTINYNHPGRALDASLGYRVRVPSSYPLLLGERLNPRVVQLHFSPGSWYVYLGTPGNSHNYTGTMVSLNMGFDVSTFGRLGFDVGSYFDMGSRLPDPPALPPAVASHLGDFNFVPSSAGASGVMAGVHASFALPQNTAFTVWGFGVKMSAEAGMGIDMAFRHLPAMNCSGRSDFGINNWYAEARGYLYGNAALKGSIRWADFNILSVGFYSAIMAQLPNPTAIRGKIKATVGLPIYGDYNMKVGFNVGEGCDMEVDDGFIEDLTLEELIESFAFEKAVDSVDSWDRNTTLIAEFTRPINSVEEYDLGQGNTLRTRINWTVSISERKDANTTTQKFYFEGRPNGVRMAGDPIHTSVQNRGLSLHIRMSDANGEPILDPEKTYVVRVAARLMMSENNSAWEQVTNAGGNPIGHTKVLEFATKAAPPPVIQRVIASQPYLQDPCVHPGDIPGGIGFVEYANENLLTNWGYSPRLRVVITDQGSGEEIIAEARRRGSNRIEFDLPALEARTMYSIHYQVASRVAGAKYSNIMESYFETSYYNTLEEKLDDLQLTAERRNWFGDQGYFILNVKCKEPFSERELPEDLTYIVYENLMDGRPTAWNTYRMNMINYAVRNGISLAGLPEEFNLIEEGSIIATALTLQKITTRMSNPSYFAARLSGVVPYETVLQYSWKPNRFLKAVRTKILISAALNPESVYPIVGQQYQPLESILGRVKLNVMSQQAHEVSFTTQLAARGTGK